MNLQERLNAQRAQFEKTAPKDVLGIFHRVTDDLRRSGIMDRILKVGDTAPEFELNNAFGDLRRSKNYLSDGPLIVGFYRGKW